jgi:hypothetical protein
MSQVDESLLLEHRADSNRAQADGMPGKSLGRDRGYVGRILFGLSKPLVLGSLRALIPAAIAALSPIVLTHLLFRKTPALLVWPTAPKADSKRPRWCTSRQSGV